MGKRILEADNLFFSYHTLTGETTVLTDISFYVEQGEFV